jgi:hypothetical protein
MAALRETRRVDAFHERDSCFVEVVSNNESLDTLAERAGAEARVVDGQ